MAVRACVKSWAAAFSSCFHMQFLCSTICELRWRCAGRLTAYPACKPEAVLAGADFVDADDNIPETVVVDGNLVRALCPQSYQTLTM